MSLGLAACEKKQSKMPSDPNHIVLDDYEIRYKGAAVMPDVDGQSAVVLTQDLPIMAKATSYLWAVSEKVFLDGSVWTRQPCSREQRPVQRLRKHS